MTRKAATFLALALWSPPALGQPSPYDEDQPASSDPTPSEAKKGAATEEGVSPVGATTEEGTVADASADLCISSFLAAQRSRYAGRLIQARQQLIQCASPTCPSALRSQCGPWLNELRPLIPTIIVVAKDLLGRDTGEVRVTVDGELVADKLDGMPIELDPGVHDVQLEHEGREPISRRVVLAQGKQNYEVSVDFSQMDIGSEEAPAVPAPPPPPIPPMAWVGISIGGAGLLLGVTSGIVALERSSSLHDECASAGGCTRREIDEALGFAHASTIGFGIAGAGMITTTIALLLAWPQEHEDAAVLGPRLGPWLGPETVGVELRF